MEGRNENNHLSAKSVHKPKRRWLVDEFLMERDWQGLTKLLKTNSDQLTNDGFYKRLEGLLSSTAKHQKHFVVRNSSLNILYGIVLTWVNESNCGHLVYILVEKSKRLQSIGKNLHLRAIRYLIKERKCNEIVLGSSFPLISLGGNNNKPFLKVWAGTHKFLRRRVSCFCKI